MSDAGDQNAAPGSNPGSVELRNRAIHTLLAAGLMSGLAGSLGGLRSVWAARRTFDPTLISDLEKAHGYTKKDLASKVPVVRYKDRKKKKPVEKAASVATRHFAEILNAQIKTAETDSVSDTASSLIPSTQTGQVVSNIDKGISDILTKYPSLLWGLAKGVAGYGVGRFAGGMGADLIGTDERKRRQIQAFGSLAGMGIALEPELRGLYDKHVAPHMDELYNKHINPAEAAVSDEV